MGVETANGSRRMTKGRRHPDRMRPDSQTIDAVAHIGLSRTRVQRRGLIRELVFGAQDGLLTTLGLVAGVSGASAGRTTVLIAGFAGGVAGMLAMGAGAYIANRSQQEVQEAEIEHEQAELKDHPRREIQELVELFVADGLSGPDARKIAAMIARQPKAMLKAMAEKELGIASEIGNPLLQSVVIAIAFLIGAIVPIVPWTFAPETPLAHVGPFGPSAALVLSVIATAFVLFGIGAGKGLLAGRSPARGGLQIAIVGLACAAIAFFLGTVVPDLAGLHPVG
jgi:vacuolar iron transporter family protein